MNTQGDKQLRAPTALMLVAAIREIVENQKGPCTWEVDQGTQSIYVYDENGNQIGQVKNQ